MDKRVNQDPPYLVGCCGWSEGKARYFADFPAVEMQSTFYEPPSVALASKWRALAPDSFHFCMKAWQLITHTPASPTYRRLKSKLSPAECELVGSFRHTEQVWLAWERTASIARVLRARIILFQCPASFRPERENIHNLRSFFSSIEREEFQFAWEPRGEWPAGTVQQLCGELNLIHCIDPFKADAATTARTAGDAANAGVTYWRLHGRGGYAYRYSDGDLADLMKMLLKQTEDVSGPAYVFFNNIWMKDDALKFRDLIAFG